MLKVKRIGLFVFLASSFVNISQAEDSTVNQQDVIHGSVMVPYPENAAVSLGMGWNLQTNKSVPNVCIKNFESYDVSKNQRSEELIQGNNSFSLSRSLDVSSSESVSMTADYAGVSGHASMSNQMQMTQQFDEKTDDRYVLAKQNIITKWSAIKSSNNNLIDLTDAAKKLTTDTSNAQFSEQCGHGYVARIEYGGSFYGLFNMHTTGYSSTQNFKSDFQQAAGASYSGIGSASADESSSSNMAKSLNKTVNSEDISITVLESGGAASAAGTDIVSVLDQYKNFPLSFSDNDAATEFRMVIVPYPNMAPLSQFDAQLLAIAREYGKWKYLATTLGKIISSKHDNDSQYTFIKGVTLSPEGLDNMQDMAQAKLDRISNVARTCMDRLRGRSKSSANSTTDPCSLNSKNPDNFQEQGINKVKFISRSRATGKNKTYYVPIAESDVSYLVRLPFLSSIYDAMTQVKVGTAGATQYSDVIFNQVMGIYKERCNGEIIPRFCEDASKVDQAIATYISPTDTDESSSGAVYSKIKSESQESGNQCLSFTSVHTKLLQKPCDLADSNAHDKMNMYFYIDKKKKLTRSLSGYCIKTEELNHDNEYNYANFYGGVCPDKYNGSTAPTNKYKINNEQFYSDFNAKSFAKSSHVFVLSDQNILNIDKDSGGDIGNRTCVGVESTTPQDSTCTPNGWNEFSFQKPLFVTDEELSQGIINAYRLDDSSVVVATPTVDDYKNIGLTGVTLKNLDKLNSQLRSNFKTGKNPTVEDIQNFLPGNSIVPVSDISM